MAQIMAPEERRMSKEMQECVDNLRMCTSACWDTMDYCLKKGGKHEEHSHIKLMIDCAEMCQTALSFIDRKSEFVHQVCDACAGICQRCADDCDTFRDDIHMQECASVCQKCADSCRRMSQVSGSSI